MGCGQEGTQITTVPFQLWALKGGIQCLPDTPPAPGHSPWLCSCSTGQMLPIFTARELLDIYALLQGHKGRTAVSRWYREVYQDHYITLCIKDANTRANALLCTSTYVKRSMRQYLFHKGSFMSKSHPIFLGLIITQLRQLQNLYLCGSLVYIEKHLEWLQILHLTAPMPVSTFMPE